MASIQQFVKNQHFAILLHVDMRGFLQIFLLHVSYSYNKVLSERLVYMLGNLLKSRINMCNQDYVGIKLEFTKGHMKLKCNL